MIRPLLVTSALPYANGPLHMGHMVEYIQTDIFVRFHRSCGTPCYYVCADDAHGTPIMLRAQAQNQDPEVYIQTSFASHKADFDRYHIQFDIYGQTHCAENERLCQDFYAKAHAKHAVYTQLIAQLYCPDCALFLPDRLIKGQCPACHAPAQYGDVCERCSLAYKPTDLIAPYCAQCHATPIEKNSTHHFFNLKQFQPFLEQWLATSKLDTSVKNKLGEWFHTGLNDWDISRDPPYFGFKIPDSEQYFYVWVDAPLGYIAMTQKLEAILNRPLWNTAEIHHFIGKDILYFHGLFWPAMLKVLDYQLPTHLHVHGFLTVNNEKMSKSRGTLMLASEFEHAPELLRYYYATKLSGDMRDLDYNTADFITRINADILGKLVNIGSRTCAILKKRAQNRLSLPSDTGLLNQIIAAKSDIQAAYQSLNYNRATRLIMQLADSVNGYIHEQAPWSCDDDATAQSIATTALQAWRYLAVYMHPILPILTQKIGDILNASISSYDDLALLPPDHCIADYYHIIQRLR